MSIIRQLTEAEADQLWLESLILKKAEAIHHFCAVSTVVNAEFWSRDHSRLIPLLNADIARSLLIMTDDLAINIPANASLDSIGVPQFSARAPVTPGRSDITFDGKQFIYVAPLEFKPIPEA